MSLETKNIIVVLVTLPVAIISQGFDEVPEHENRHQSVVDSRSASMGRTSIVSATGSNAIFSNPGIIATLENWQGQAGGRLVMGTMEKYLPSSILDSWEGKMPPHFSNNHVSVAILSILSGFGMRFAFGIGYRSFFDYGMKMETRSEIVDRVKSSWKYNQSGGLNVLTTTFAINLQDRFFIGASFNKSILGANWERTTKSKYTEVEYYDTRKVELINFAKFSQVGGLVIVNSRLAVGFSFTPGFLWEYENQWGERDGYRTRLVVGFGASYQFSQTLLVAVEIQKKEYYANSPNANIFRIGAEYKGPVSLRFGFFSDATESLDSFPGFTGGIGYDLGIIRLDAFAEYSTYDSDYYGTVELNRFGLSIANKI